MKFYHMKYSDKIFNQHIKFQTLESPGYTSPRYYPPNTRCQWLIEAPPSDAQEGTRRRRMYGRNQGRRVHLKFLSMDVGVGTSSSLQPCSQGYVSLQDHRPQV